MRIWLDGQCLQTSSRERGIGRYALELIRGVSFHFPDVDLSISFNAAMADDLLRARDLVSGLIRPENIYSWHSADVTGETISGLTPQRQLSEIALAHHVRCIAPDIAIELSPFEGAGDMAVPLNPAISLNCPVVGIFYDAIPFRFPKEYIFSKGVKTYYERRFGNQTFYDGLLCISEFTKSEAEDIFKSVPAFCIDAGVPTQLQGIFNNGHDIKETYRRKPNDILYVGALDWRKNVDRVVDAFAILNERGLDQARLVIAGSYHQDGAQEIKAKWSRLGLQENNLFFRGQVSDKELCDLYLESGLAIQPSLMEGFGLTALEAMYFHCPVLGSNVGALKEIVVTPLAMFDPLDAQDMASVIQNVISHDDVRERILDAQMASPSKYTWERTSGLFMEAVQSIALNKSEAYKKQSRREAVKSSRILSAKKVEKVDLSLADKAMALALAEPTLEPRPRLVVDATATILADHKTGIQRVVKQICRHLAESVPGKDVSRVIGFCDDELGWFDTGGSISERPAKRNSRKIYLRENDTMLMLDSSWLFFDIHAYFFKRARVRGSQVISCLYDTVPISMPAMCDPGMPPAFASWFKTALVHSTGFVCISRAVADELHALLEAIAFPRRMKIGFWQLGADFSGPGKETLPQKKVKERPAFLMVGTLEPRKGHRVALDAFEQLWAENVDVTLVIVGKIGWGSTHIIERIRRHPQFGHRLIWRSAVEDDELVQLYRECDALIAASFAEGFGLPLVEAAHFGMPVLASDIPVFREVAGGASDAHFFEGGSPTALSSKVKEFLKYHRSPKTGKDDHTSWPTWAESAAQLETIVLSENWYKIYEPRSRMPNVPVVDIGHIRMTSCLDESGRLNSIRLIEGPFSPQDAGDLKIIVAVQNLSNSVWSSQGELDGSLAVMLSYHVIDSNGAVLAFGGPRHQIPFVHIPGETHYMAVNVPTSWKERGAAFVDIELVQEGVLWFGNPLRVPL